MLSARCAFNARTVRFSRVVAIPLLHVFHALLILKRSLYCSANFAFPQQLLL